MNLFPAHLIKYKEPENYNNSDQKLFYDSNFVNQIERIDLKELNNIRIANNLIIKRVNVFWAFSHHLKPSLKSRIKGALKKHLTDSTYLESAIWGMQEWAHNYFHWMTESLPLILAAYQKKNIPVLLSKQHLKYPHIKASLDLLNIPFCDYDLKSSVKVKKLYAIQLPIVSFYNEFLLNNFKNTAIDLLSLTSEKKPYRNIYISRKKATKRKIINEEKLLSILTENHFELIYMENYSIADQIKILFESKVVISSHGAGLTNILFMQPNTSVIELKANNNDYWCYFSLARAAKLNYYYILCESDSINHRVANIIVNENKVKETLLKLG